MKIAEDINRISNWNRSHAGIVLVAAVLCLVNKNAIYLLLGSAASICFFIFNNRDTLEKLKPFGGYANWVTGVRFVILMALMFCLQSLSFWQLGLGLLVFVSLDGVDGWLARKYNHSTVFGQYFDMELDALFVMMMCCYYYLFKEIDIWILIPGFMRYVYRIGIEIFPKENFIETKKKYASSIAGVFFTILIVALFVGHDIRLYGLAIGSFLIVLSFGISIVEYMRFDNLVKTQ